MNKKLIINEFARLRDLANSDKDKADLRNHMKGVLTGWKNKEDSKYAVNVWNDLYNLYLKGR